jgi:DNA-binding NtrC family response regulator
MTKLLIVDDDADLRDMLKEFFELTTSTTCVAVGSLAELEKVRDQALECSLAILDINLGAEQPSGLDVFAWLRTAGFRGKVAFVTGHADNHPLVRRAASEAGVKVYKKPMEIERLMELVKGV